jgi:hypothetical protein
MKFLIILFSIIFCISNISFRAFQNCDSVKKGNFTYYAYNIEEQCIIERNDSIQSETIISNGKTVQTKVKWLNECEYTLTFLNANFYIPDSIINILKVSPVYTSIIKIEKDYYISSSKIPNETQKVIDTLKRIQPTLRRQ